MRECFQFGSMSILDHGHDVREWYLDIEDHIVTGESRRPLRLPGWISSPVILPYLQDLDDRLTYLYQVYHDCGKPLCRTVDGEGRPHYPEHAEASRRRWLECSDGSPEALAISELIAMDMDVHRLRPEDVDGFASRPQAILLLLTGLAELHSNAQMFGGTESDGFKIKYKRIERLGGRIIRKIEEGK